MRGGIRGFLYDCRSAIFEIESIKRQMSMVNIPGTPQFNSASVVESTGKDNDPTATAMHNMDYYEEILQGKMAGLKNMLIHLEELMDALPEGKIRTVMRYYYAQGLSNATIADMLDISEKTATRRRVLAVQTLERKFDVETKCPSMSHGRYANMVFKKK